MADIKHVASERLTTGHLTTEQTDNKSETLVDTRQPSLNEEDSSEPSRDGEKQLIANEVVKEAKEKVNDVETAVEHGVANEESQDDNTITWDSDTDPANPMNWTSFSKILNCVLVSSLSFLTPLGSSMFAPGVPSLLMEFNSRSTTLGSLVVSIYVLGFAAGPMVFAPLSEIYGRLIVYHFSNIGFLAFTIGCAAAPSLPSLIGFRFLAGLCGSVPMTNGGGSITDMIAQEKRGVAMSAFAVGPLLGPIIGPVVGGYVSGELGWRWVFWIISMVSGFVTITFFLFARETYAPTILQRKVNKLRKSTNNPSLYSKLDSGLQPKDFFKRGILRPCKMLLFSPICQIASLYVALAYGYMYLMFASLSPLVQQIYHFTTGEAGLAFLGLGSGSMIGMAFFAIMSDSFIKKKAVEEALLAETEGREPEGMKPEYRLPPLKYGAFALPAGLFIYGWTADYAVHWIVPIIGTSVMGAGNLLIFMVCPNSSQKGPS